MWCLLRGHDAIPVRRVPGTLRRDGREVYALDPTGQHRACLRCWRVLK